MLTKSFVDKTLFILNVDKLNSNLIRSVDFKFYKKHSFIKFKIFETHDFNTFKSIEKWKINDEKRKIKYDVLNRKGDIIKQINFENCDLIYYDMENHLHVSDDENIYYNILARTTI